jgi:hypothetical protein
MAKTKNGPIRYWKRNKTKMIIKIESLKIKGLKIKGLKIQGLKIQGLKIQGLKIHSLIIQIWKLQDLKN